MCRKTGAGWRDEGSLLCTLHKRPSNKLFFQVKKNSKMAIASGALSLYYLLLNGRCRETSVLEVENETSFWHAKNVS